MAVVLVCEATPKCFGRLYPPTPAEEREMLDHLNDPRSRPTIERLHCVGKCERCGSFRYIEVDA